jgi:MFS family permease
VRRSLVRDRQTWLTYGHLAIFGYYIYGFGPVVPLLRDEQGTTRAVASLHGTALAVGGVLGAVVMPWLVHRFGRVPLMWAGQTGIAAGLIGLAASAVLPATLAWILFVSFCGTFVVNGVSAVLADRHGPAGTAAISEANALAAGVGTVSPLIVGAFVAAGLGWRPGLMVLGLGTVALAVLTVVTAARAPAPPAPGPVSAASAPAAPAPAAPVSAAPAAASARPPRPRLPRPFWFAWTALLATVSIEVCLNLWVADVLRTHAHVPAGAATAAVSAMVGGMFLGRLVGARLLLRLSAPRVLLGALGLTAVGFTIFWLATAPWLAVAGLLVCGLGNAMHYPVAIGLALGYSGGRPDVAASRATYAVGLSFGLAPFALGALADRVGPHPAFLTVFAALALAAAAASRLLATARDEATAARDKATAARDKATAARDEATAASAGRDVPGDAVEAVLDHRGRGRREEAPAYVQVTD